jgi:pSer/pThr/pTyr-binding forkhead associated (FHA) protein
MTTKVMDDEIEGTALDPELARPRLKESLVEGSTGIFLKIKGAGGRNFTLSSGGIYLIGREGADVALSDTKVSRKHAEISLLGPDAYFLRDLASTNGTFLNSVRVSDKVAISHGDEIRVGDTLLTFSVVLGAVAIST